LKPIYITHTCALTPQHQSEDSFLLPAVRDEHSRLHVIEPDYSAVIPPVQLRRMSRLLKMGVFAGMDCLRQSGIATPDGIITGTGKGSMLDTEKFVKELKSYNEEALNPTPFILSTYNAINGAIALQTNATGYNQTFVHRGSSLEVSLYDAQLKLNPETEPRHYLVGSFDEITPEYYLVKDKINYWKRDRDNSLPLWDQSTGPGTIAGEGTAFFMVSNQPERALMAIEVIHSFYRPDINEVSAIIAGCVEKAGWQHAEIDLLVLGFNGDKDDEVYYQEVMGMYPYDVPVLAFKHLCGEYETSGGFALWLTAQLLSGAALPQDTWYRKGKGDKQRPSKILYYNHYRGLNHNVLLLSR
jgi:3-oxoacyl-[acyl-carrier-protein] synthase II